MNTTVARREELELHALCPLKLVISSKPTLSWAAWRERVVALDGGSRMQLDTWIAEHLARNNASRRWAEWVDAMGLPQLHPGQSGPLRAAIEAGAMGLFRSLVQLAPDHWKADMPDRHEREQVILVAARKAASHPAMGLPMLDVVVKAGFSQNPLSEGEQNWLHLLAQANGQPWKRGVAGAWLEWAQAYPDLAQTINKYGETPWAKVARLHPQWYSHYERGVLGEGVAGGARTPQRRRL